MSICTSPGSGKSRLHHILSLRTFNSHGWGAVFVPLILLPNPLGHQLCTLLVLFLAYCESSPEIRVWLSHFYHLSTLLKMSKEMGLRS
jgi:hypothetical protein